MALAGAGPAFANPVGSDSSPGGSIAAATAFAPTGPNLRLDGRAAGRMLADAKETDPTVPPTEDDKGKPAEKSDDIKMTVTKGPAGATPQKASGSDGTFAFMKDWPFWVAVGGVVIAGGALLYINSNSHQNHTCSTAYSGGCFGAN